MLVKRDDLPTEGIHINKIHFKPGEAVEVDEPMGQALTARKGFVEVTKTKKKKEEGGGGDG